MIALAWIAGGVALMVYGLAGFAIEMDRGRN